MVNRYLEIRRRISAQPANIAADTMRYVQVRQYLGRTVVVCDDPEAFLALASKQWLRLSRALQRRRTATADAEKILDYTRTITHMQRMTLAANPPHELPDATVFFARADQLKLLPPDCVTLCLATATPERVMERLLQDLAPASLVVDYADQLHLGDYGLLPKHELEAHVAIAWRRVANFLLGQSVNPEDLSLLGPNSSDSFDDALDVLLPVSDDFLRLAGAFQRALDLARPLRGASKPRLENYDAIARLAVRVQALTPGLSHPAFFQGVADDAFFFNDAPRASAAYANLIAAHVRAGRLNLARALMGLAGQAPIKPALYPVMR